MKIHPHLLFESLAYAVAFRLMLRNVRTDAIAFSQSTSVIVGGLVGALIGAKGLVLLQHIDLLGQDWQRFLLLFLQGKTVVGAMLGGLIGVELTKQWIGLKQSTGDAFVYPLIMGTAIGRVGCFLTGLKNRIFNLFSTSHSPESSAASLKQLLCYLPMLPMPEGISYENIFRILVVRFLDSFNFDVRSVKRSCIYIVHPDERIIPFDKFNLFYREGSAGHHLIEKKERTI